MNFCLPPQKARFIQFWVNVRVHIHGVFQIDFIGNFCEPQNNNHFEQTLWTSFSPSAIFIVRLTTSNGN